MNQLPVLQVLIPLLSAPFCILLRKTNGARAWATATCGASFAVACALYLEVMAHGVISYHLGGWQPPWGIELRIDAMTVLLLLVVTGIATVVATIGIGDKSHGIQKGLEAYFYAAYLLCLTGLIGMTITGDAFNVFVFLEISSLSTYTLIALGRSRRALSAALSYLMLGTVGGTFILLGIGLLYQLTGSLNMADISQILPSVSDNKALPVAFAFLMVGIGLKVAIFPLHQWLPNAYAFAPSAVSAFVAGTATKVMYYLLIRFSFSVFGVAIVFGTFGLKQLLMPLSLMAMFAGSIAAIYQKDLKRLLAYSSIAQLGYLTLALSFGTTLGVQAGLIHVVNHAIMKSGLFLIAAAIVAQVGSCQIKDLAGLGRRFPLTMAGLVVGGLGLIGVPGTAGFVSKWYLVLAALDGGDVGVAAAILVSSLLAVVYVWRLLEVIYFGTPADEAQSPTTPVAQERPGILLPAWTLIAATVFFGVFTEMPTKLAQVAAEQVTSQVKPSVVIGSGPHPDDTHHSGHGGPKPGAAVEQHPAPLKIVAPNLRPTAPAHKEGKAQ